MINKNISINLSSKFPHLEEAAMSFKEYDSHPLFFAWFMRQRDNKEKSQKSHTKNGGRNIQNDPS